MTPTLSAACPVTWPAKRACNYWGPKWGIHGCNLTPGHDGDHICGCHRRKRRP